MKVEFRTQYEPHERVFASAGDSVKRLYGMQVDKKTGEMCLVEKGTEKLYDYIQSHADSVDINLLLKRYANGDQDSLNARIGSYGDFLDCPVSLAEMYNTLVRGEELFASLPSETRANFNNSFSEFAAAVGSPSFYDRLGLTRQEASPIVQDSIVSEEGEE